MQILLSTRIESVPASKLKRIIGHDLRFNKTNNVSKDGENKAYIFDEDNTPTTALSNSKEIINSSSGYYFENLSNPLKSLAERLGDRGGLSFTFKDDKFLRNPNLYYFNKDIKNIELANNVRNLLLHDFDSSIANMNNHIRSQIIEKTGYKRSLGNFNHFQMGVLTFGVDEATKQKRGQAYKDADGLTPDEANYINSIDRDTMDKCMLDYMDKFEKTYGVKIKYLVNHFSSEKVVHYHFMFENYNYEIGKSFKTIYAPTKSKLIQLGSDLQDLAGNAFTPLHINRGSKKHLTNARHKSISQMHESQLQEQQQIINTNELLIDELGDTIAMFVATANDLDYKVRTLKEEYTQHNSLKREYIQLQKNYSKDSIKYNELSLKIKEYQKLDQETRKQHKSAKSELSSVNSQIKKIKTQIDDTKSFKDETYQLIKDYVLENTQKGLNGFLISDVQEFVLDISDAINDAADLELISKIEQQLQQQVSVLSKYKDLYTQSNSKEVLDNIIKLQANNQEAQKKLKKAMDLIKHTRYHKRLKSSEIDKLKGFLKDKGLLSNYLDIDLLHSDMNEL